MSNYGSLHTHSRYSSLDGLTSVASIVEKAAALGHPFVGLTDHGNLAGATELYLECRKHNIKPFIGIETYIIDPEFGVDTLDEANTAERYHLGIVALNTEGYKALVKLSSLSHTRPRRHGNFARLLYDDLINLLTEHGEDVAVLTGCVSGLIQKHLINGQTGKALGMLQQMVSLSPNIIVELQHHGLTFFDDVMTERELQATMVSLADSLGIHVVITPDSHYTDQCEAHSHNLMKTMVYGSGEFSGDYTYHFPSADWLRDKFDAEIWEKAEKGYKYLLDKHALDIPMLNQYQPHVPEVSTNADDDLRAACESQLIHWLKDGTVPQEKAPEYWDRLKEELRVISKIEMSNYFLFEKIGSDFCAKNNIAIEARGSAAGSMVAWLFGLTQVDPIKWGTVFERFLSEDRTGDIPDIDLDIEASERHRILHFLANLEVNGVRYDTEQIGTFNALGQTEGDESDAGSAFRTYASYLKKSFYDDVYSKEQKRCEELNERYIKKNATALADQMWRESDASKIKTIDAVKYWDKNEYEALKKIIELDSVTKSFGVHAGGIVLGAEQARIAEWVPTMLVVSSDTRVTQFDMESLKHWGLAKVDWLGQRILTTMKRCQELMGRQNPGDFSWIPDDCPQVAAKIKKASFHPGLFHLEGWTKSKGAVEMGLATTQDYTLWQALYMPGAMQSGATALFNSRRKNPSLMKEVPYTHPLLKEVFDPTNGVMIYQEQVLQVARGIGMTGANLTSFFKVIKDSGKGAVERNKQRLEEKRPQFNEMARSTGLSDVEIDWVWKQFIAMGGYGFNKAHAVSYGIRAYRSAYLKTHYPTEYMAALIETWSGGAKITKGRDKGKTKEEVYVEEAVRMGISILPVDVEKSGVHYTLEEINGKKYLRKGLTSVRLLGDAAAQELVNKRPFANVTDLITRCESSKVKGGTKWRKTGELTSVLGTLRDINALDSLLDKEDISGS